MAIIKSEGFNESEQLLNSLCQKSFLSLWTYPNLFRDQGKKGEKSDGKEVCDAIAVFGEHIIIFSDKSCAFPNSGSVDVDWGRWYRNAIKKSMDQLLGAKRWIMEHPDRVFIDKACTVPLPIQFPPQNRMKFHLIAVARGAGDRCQQYFRGSGSLPFFSPQTVQTFRDNGLNLPPFHIGGLASNGEYIHVLDDVTTEIVLRTLDTAPDLIRYLSEKERFVNSRYFRYAAGEEELLAYYMQSWSEEGSLSFTIPPCQPPEMPPEVILSDGLWDELTSETNWQALQEWWRPSYFWDHLIDNFAFHTLEGTLYEVDDASPSYQETLLRFLSAEPRYRRRALSIALLGQLQRAPKDEYVDRSARVSFSTKPSEPSYVFLVVGSRQGETQLDYRKRRRVLLINYCTVVKHMHPSSRHIIGIGIEPKDMDQRSEDMIYLDATEWTLDMAADAAELYEAGILKHIQQTHSTIGPRNYADIEMLANILEEQADKKPGRNDPCPCGSGVKFKRCHGRE